MEKEPIHTPGITHAPVWLEQIDSTNDECKRRALKGAPDGFAVIARKQTGGKGRRGRRFQSLQDKGLYLSVLLYPQADPSLLSQLTAWTAVAAARAVERASGIAPDIKWPNDLLVNGKKLCGILTESGSSPKGLYVVIGIGVNLTQTDQDFGPELSPIAISLAQLGKAVSPQEMASPLLEELDRMYRLFPLAREDYLSAYRRRCVTLGKPVRLVEAEQERTATALDIGEDFSLRVRLADGHEEQISSGEVSVRGLLGYD